LPRDEKLAKKLIDNGVDLVIMSHAHRVQTMEIYKGKHIFYGIGDCIFDHFDNEVWENYWKPPAHPYEFGFNPERGITKYSLVIKIEINKNNFQVNYYPIKSKNFGPWVMTLNENNQKKWILDFERLNNKYLEDKNVLHLRNEIENKLLQKLNIGTINERY
jgi:hypothetical protein